MFDSDLDTLKEAITFHPNSHGNGVPKALNLVIEALNYWTGLFIEDCTKGRAENAPSVDNIGQLRFRLRGNDVSVGGVSPRNRSLRRSYVARLDE